MFLSQFQTVGGELFARGLISSQGGNLSIRMGDRILITRRGSRLSCLEENDLVETGLDKNDRATPLASIELAVHRAIYRETTARAIVHAHPPHSVALSLVETEIVPTGVECQPLVGRVPVLGWNMEVKPGGLADIIAGTLGSCHIVVVRGHGTFAVGQLLEEALDCTSTFEESCQVICLSKSLKVAPPEE